MQLAGTNPDEMAWAAALAEARGADFVDVNLGCPIDHFTRKGMGAALARQPSRVRRIVESMAKATSLSPITVKIRLGWNDSMRNHVDLARAAVDGGAQAVFVHGRTRDARYRRAADWAAIGEVAAAVPDRSSGTAICCFPMKSTTARVMPGCAGVMVSRGALIKPWIFCEVTERLSGRSPPTDRLTIYRRYAALALEHWRDDERGRATVLEFLKWHLNFWCRYAPQRADGSWPTMQERESDEWAVTPLDRVLARTDAAAHEWLAQQLFDNAPVEPAHAPASGERSEVNAPVLG